MTIRHGHRPRGRFSPTYMSWIAMKQRCYNQKSKGYERYGERGIMVCDRWLGDQGFENFLADLGERPSGTSLDRFPNNDGNYEPGNVRWATRAEQCHSRMRQFDLAEIRRLLSLGWLQREVAALFKTTQGTISHLLSKAAR